jgi:tetratricopeptide (TPR) repeat protein/transcriptional regulator with XRE-family HTH domain
MGFGQRLRQERLLHHLSQEALAEALGTSSKSIIRWEQGKTIPQGYTRLQLCRFFHLRPEELFTEFEDQISPSEIWNVPYPRNPFFIGREELLHSLHTQLNQEHTTALTQSLAISGLGGIGKTQLALEYAYQYRQTYCYVFWTSAATQESLLEGVFAIADLLQLPERSDHDQNKVLQAVEKWFATHQRWLWILDNADDPALVYDIVPKECPGHLLLTSRAQAFGTLAQPIKVEKMGLAEGTLLLLRRSRLLASSTSLDLVGREELRIAEAIVMEMDFLPLALDQAGAYIEEVKCSLSAYLELYRMRRKQLLHHRGHIPTNYPRSVATTWSLSFQKVEQTHPAATDLLRLCAFLHPDAIPEELFVAGGLHLGARLGPAVTDAYQFNLILAALQSVSLITRSPATQTLSMHRLVQVVVRDQIDLFEMRVWNECIIRMVHASFPDGTLGTWAQCERYLAQALACVPLIEHASNVLLEAGEMFYNVGNYLLERGRFGEAESLLERAVALGEQHYGADHLEVIPRLEKYAELFWRQGRYERCEPLIYRVLALRQHHLGLQHPQVAEALNNLALLYWHQGKYEQAEPLYQQALTLGEHLLGLQHPQVADTLNNLALLYKTQGKYEQAEPLHQRALSIYELESGPEHPQTARALNNLATLYDDQEKYEQAEPLFQRALRIWEGQLGSEHPQMALALNNLAFAYRAQEKYEQAEPLYQRALALREQVLGLDHPLTGGTLTGLGTLYREQGHYEQALPFYQRALIICEQRLGPEHPQTADTLYHLAILYWMQGKYEQAEPLYQQALSVYEQRLGATHPQTVKMRNSPLRHQH